MISYSSHQINDRECNKKGALINIINSELEVTNTHKIHLKNSWFLAF